MCTTNLSLKEIAADVGMHHASHLNLFFRKHLGRSPGSLRKLLQNYKLESADFLTADPTGGPIPERFLRWMKKQRN